MARNAPSSPRLVSARQPGEAGGATEPGFEAGSRVRKTDARPRRTARTGMA